MLDPYGHVVTWNAGARLMKGYEDHEIIGKHFSKFYSRKTIQEGFPEYELEIAKSEGRFEDEGWRYRKNGTAFWANVVITPIYHAGNRLLGFAKITRDLTERRRNEELLRKSNKDLMRINSDLDNFVYTASHDLKTPITNLEGLLTVLQNDLGINREKHEELLYMMKRSVITLKTVTNGLANVTQLQQEKVNFESVNLWDLIEEVKESLHDIINASKAEIKVDNLEFDSL